LEEGRRKKEEARGKMEDRRGKKQEGRWKKEDGRRKLTGGGSARRTLDMIRRVRRVEHLTNYLFPNHQLPITPYHLLLTND
jgi:hypothetical protein